MFELLKWFALFAVLVIFLFPLFWIITSSLKTRGEFFTRPPIWIPSHAEWSNYPDSLGRGARQARA